MTTESEVDRTCRDLDESAARLRDLLKERDDANDRNAELEDRIAELETERDLLADENADLRKEARRP
jgi:predicted  nucleic acid-binding Zn-ribbon protein